MRSPTGRGSVLAALVAMVFVLSMASPSGVRCAEPSGNGDVNGSGALDIADAI